MVAETRQQLEEGVFSEEELQALALAEGGRSRVGLSHPQPKAKGKRLGLWNWPHGCCSHVGREWAAACKLILLSSIYNPGCLFYLFVFWLLHPKILCALFCWREHSCVALDTASTWDPHLGVTTESHPHTHTLTCAYPQGDHSRVWVLPSLPSLPPPGARPIPPSPSPSFTSADQCKPCFTQKFVSEMSTLASDFENQMRLRTEVSGPSAEETLEQVLE